VAVLVIVNLKKASLLLEVGESLPINRIRESPRLLRESVGDLKELSLSIQQIGVIQPIIVRPVKDDFELVAGFRRLSACKQLRLSTIPCIIRSLSDKDAYEISLVENVQRQTLNPIEEANAFRKYVQEFGYGGTSDLARRIGKSEEYVSQRILLLNLPPEIVSKVISRELSPSAARELVWLKDESKQIEMADCLARHSIPVKRIHEVVMAAKCGISAKEAFGTVVNEYSNPEFEIHERVGNDRDCYLKALEKVIVILRVSMLRVDTMVDGAKTEEIRKMLITKRYRIHQMIDESIREKISAEGHESN
jgi:ParB family transcriptional regulator, chromosome partitioning protein